MEIGGVDATSCDILPNVNAAEMLDVFKGPVGTYPEPDSSKFVDCAHIIYHKAKANPNNSTLKEYQERRYWKLSVQDGLGPLGQR